MRVDLAGGGIALDEEDRARRIRAGVFLEDLRQAAAVHRLGGVIGGAQREAPLAVVHHRQHDDRDVAQVGVGFQRREHAPAVHVGHHHVQRDGRRLQLSRQPQPLLATCGGADAKTLLSQKALHQVALPRVVIDDQHAAFDGRAFRRTALGCPTGTSDFTSSTTAGSVMVKTLPSSGTLCTVTSPPII